MRIKRHYGCRINLPHNDYDDYYDGLVSNDSRITGNSLTGYVDFSVHYDELACISCMFLYDYPSVYNSMNVKTLLLYGNTVNYDDLIEIAEKINGLEYLYITSWEGDINTIVNNLNDDYPELTLIWDNR